MTRTFAAIGIVVGLFLGMYMLHEEPIESYQDMVGYIVGLDQASILVTQMVPSDSTYAKATSYTITNETELLLEDGTPVSAETLQLGMTVEMWHTGVEAESFPTQATATLIVVYADEEDLPISQADAIGITLSKMEKKTAWWIKQVELDMEAASWNVTLVDLLYDSKPLSFTVDAYTGAIQEQSE